ncbi:MAG: RNA polymerase sigma factor [Acidobacteriota bacterium]
MELATLLNDCKRGDELAWEALVRRYQGRVHGIAYHYVGNHEDARDLAQDIFVRLYKNLSLCTDAQRFVPWMIRIARNASIDFLRRQKARSHVRDVPVDEMWDVADERPTPEQASANAARRRILCGALQKLTHLSREVILLKEIQGLSIEEVSILLGAPVGTIKSRSHRARLELAEQVLALAGEDRV